MALLDSLKNEQLTPVETPETPENSIPSVKGSNNDAVTIGAMTYTKTGGVYVVSRPVYLAIRVRPGSKVRLSSQDLQLSDIKNIERVGSSFRGGDVLRGLTLEEEKTYLPTILGVSDVSQNWGLLTREYWANISKDVPIGEKPEDGLKLETGMYYATKEGLLAALQEENQEWATYKRNRELNREYQMKFDARFLHGTPINPADYVLWRYLLLYSECANTPEEANNSNRIRFYLFSEAQRKQQLAVTTDLKNKAYAHYLKIAGDTETVSNLIHVLNDEQGFIPPDGNEPYELVSAVERFMQAKPSRFLEIATDANLSTKAFIQRAIQAGILRRLPNSEIIMFGDNTTLGNTLAEAIDFINTPTNQEVAKIIKAQLDN